MGEQARRSFEVVRQMLDEFRYAEACLFLFHLHDLHSDEWVETKEALLNMEQSPGRLSVLATILECSAKSELSACNTLIPGLSCYTALQEPDDLFD